MKSAKPSTLTPVIALLARWIVGGWFVYMGLSKAVVHDPATFLELVRQYNLTTSTVVLNSIAAALPWFEVFCGMMLIAGVAVRGTALVTLAMLVPFTALVLKRALAVAALREVALCAVKFDCGCGNGPQFICPKLAENGALIVLAGWLLFSRSQRFCIRFDLLRRDSASSPIFGATSGDLAGRSLPYGSEARSH